MSTVITKSNMAAACRCVARNPRPIVSRMTESQIEALAAKQLEIEQLTMQLNHLKCQLKQEVDVIFGKVEVVDFLLSKG